RLFRLKARKSAPSEPQVGGAQARVSSPRPGRSTLTTSAPRSPRIWVQYGPATFCVRSRTASPASADTAPSIAPAGAGRRDAGRARRDPPPALPPAPERPHARPVDARRASRAESRPPGWTTDQESPPHGSTPARVRARPAVALTRAVRLAGAALLAHLRPSPRWRRKRPGRRRPRPAPEVSRA